MNSQILLPTYVRFSSSFSRYFPDNFYPPLYSQINSTFSHISNNKTGDDGEAIEAFEGEAQVLEVVKVINVKELFGQEN